MYKNILVICLISLFIGCGGSSSNTNDDQYDPDNSLIESNLSKSGYLIDSAIQGVTYKTDSLSGTTDSSGKFEYNSDDSEITFTIGDITIATFVLSNINEDDTIYPTDLVNTHRTDINNTKVVKILRFVQSLDDDNNPDNGININETTRDKLSQKFNLLDDNISHSYLENHLSNLNIPYRDEDLAKEHFYKTLENKRITGDTPPIFLQTDFSPILNENFDDYLDFEAKDLEDSLFKLRYTIQGIDSKYFSISYNFGSLRFIIPPDYETKQNYSLTVTVKDTNNNASSKDINITIKNIDSNGTIFFNGHYYNEVNSSQTGRIWLDRNLGADRKCTSFDDLSCLGDFYQWGRNNDGHEKLLAETVLESNLSLTNLNDTDDRFIITNTFTSDWGKDFDSDGSQRSFNWSKIDGSSVCPIGFRVPTITELKAETLDQGIDTIEEAYDSFLNLRPTSERSYSSGRFFSLSNDKVILWSSSNTESLSVTKGQALIINNNSPLDSPSRISNSNTFYGYNIRCIKD